MKVDQKKRVFNPAKYSGFSMLEVLITLIVISIGLLGVAGVQAVALSNGGAAHSSSNAAMLANSLAASIGANQAYWGGSVHGTPSGFSPPSSVTVSDTTLAPPISTTNANCSAQDCAADEMAAYELRIWGGQLKALLPGGTGEVICAQSPQTTVSGSSSSAQYLCVIKISWNQKNIKSSATKDTTLSTSTRQTYTMVVQQ